MAAKRRPVFAWLPFTFLLIALVLWHDRKLAPWRVGKDAALIFLLVLVYVGGLWVSQRLARVVADDELNSFRKVVIAFAVYFGDSIGLVCFITGNFFGRELFTQGLTKERIMGGLVAAFAIACVFTYGHWSAMRSQGEPLITTIFGSGQQVPEVGKS